MPSLFTKILKRRKQEKEDKEKKSAKKEAKRKEMAPKKEEPEAKAEIAEEEKKIEPERKATKLHKSDVASIILVSPRITEKTNIQAEQGVYTFNIARRANKNLVKRSIEELYRVGVEKVRISNMPSKSRRVRGKKGIRPGYKKAVVYLKEGDKIEFV